MGQPLGPGLDGPVPSPRGQLVEEVSCSMILVMQDVVYPSQTVGDGNTGCRINEIVVEVDSFLTRTLFRNIDKTISH